MGIFKITKGKYGFQLYALLFGIETNLRIHRRFDTEFTIGVRNHCSDGKRIIFLDYDQTLYEEQLIPELKYLQKSYKLSNFYILKSSQKPDSYHAICLDKLNAREWVRLITETSCDNNYKLYPVIADNKSWVLRCWNKGESQKPRLIKIIESPYNKREKSLAHALHLQMNYGINIKKLINLDNNKGICYLKYGTLNYIKKIGE